MINKTLTLAALLLGFVASESAMASNLNQDDPANRPAISASLPTVVDPEQEFFERALAEINGLMNSDAANIMALRDTYDLWMDSNESSFAVLVNIRKMELTKDELLSCYSEKEYNDILKESYGILEIFKKDRKMQLNDALNLVGFKREGMTLEEAVMKHAQEELRIEKIQRERDQQQAVLSQGINRSTTEELRRQAAAANAELQKAAAQYRYN